MQLRPAAPQIVLEGALLPRHLEEHVPAVPGVREHGLHHRLLQRVHAGLRARVVPLLERVQLREHEIGRGGGLIEVGREADLVADFAERLRERAPERVDGVRAVHEKHGDLARLHLGNEVGHLTERPGALERVVGPEPDRLADLAGDVVQDIHGCDDGGAVRILRRHAPRHGEPALRGRELARDPPDRLRPDVHGCGDLLRGVRRDELTDARDVGGGDARRGDAGGGGTQPLVQDHVRHRQREDSFGPRRGGQPLVCAHPGERQPRSDVDEPGRRRVAASLERMGAGERVLIADGGKPRLHEVGSERHDVAGAGKVVPRDRRRAEGDPVPLAQRLERERFVGEVPPTCVLHPAPDQLSERAGLEARDEDGSGAARLLHFGAEPRDRLVPRERLPPAVGAARHRVRDAVRVVEPLERRLTAGAEPSLVERGLGIPLELDHASLAHLGVQSAPGGALAARGGVPGRDARNLLLGLNQVRNEMLGRLGPDAARRECGRAAARGAQHLEEASAIHRPASQ